MPLVETQNIKPGEYRQDQQQVYCGLDCGITLEVFEELQSLFNEEPLIYRFERALQGPILEMMLRGFRVDGEARDRGLKRLNEELEQLYSTLNDFSFAVWDKELNPRSSKQLKEFFYGKMRLPEHWTSQKGQRKLSMNRETLEKLEVYLYARPIIATILAIRERSKRKEVLETEVETEPNGLLRMHTSYNIAGTESGRLSSSANAQGTGTNLQNITPELRNIFIADEGWKLCSIDLEQAESREVGWLFGILFGDWSYLEACESGDLHTTTAKLIWRDKAWTGDRKKDREIAEQPFYRHFSYRDMSKRGGHLTSYYGTAWTASRHLKTPLKLMESFQDDFCLGENAAFPCFPKWWRWVAEQLQTTRKIITPFGHERFFFGRPNDDTTLREAIAYGPQSATATRTNLWLYRIWKQMGQRVQILAQVHDNVTFQFRETDDEKAIVKEALSLLHMPMVDNKSSRIFHVPGSAATGWNWGYEYTQKDANKDIALGKKPKELNLLGLRKVSSNIDERKRVS